MIDYEYPNIFITEGTQKELLITDGTVTIDGTDYEVSGETVLFENNDLELEAFELYQSINTESQMIFGSCGTAKVSFVARSVYAGSNVGKRVKVYIIPNHDASKMVQLGVFKIAEDKQSNDHLRHSMVGYDSMYDILNTDMRLWYYGQFPDTSTTMTLAQFRAAFINYFGLTAETVTLANDDMVLQRKIEVDSLSGAEIIKAICEINGVFGKITNEGKFRFVSLAPHIQLDPDVVQMDVDKYVDVEFTDYFCQFITALELRNDKTSIVSGDKSGNKYVVSYNFLTAGIDFSELGDICRNLYWQIRHHSYRPLTINALGNPLIEVGDSLKCVLKNGNILFTYVFERRLKGIQSLRDTISSNGEEYFQENLNSASYQYKELNNQINEITQGGGSSSVVTSEDFVERIRNIGFRLLDEPSNVSVEFDEENQQVELKWTDPADISTNEPCPATWAGTVVVRKEDSAPLHRWDGTLIIDSTTRDEYAETPLVDDTIEAGKQYYYGIFPYHIYLQHASHPIKHYRYTKVVSIDFARMQQLTKLLNTSEEYVNSLMLDKEDYADYNTNSWSITDYTLQKIGKNYTHFYLLKSKFEKAFATKLIVDVECSGVFGDTSTCIVSFYHTLPTSYSECWNDVGEKLIWRYGIVDRSDTSYGRHVVEIPLDLVNVPFFISFETADISNTYFRRIEFDNDVSVIVDE